MGVCVLIFGGGRPLFGQEDASEQEANVQKAAAEAQKASQQAQKASEQAQKAVNELQKVELRGKVRLIHGSEDKDNLIIALADDVAEGLPQSDYWIGVQVAAVPDVAKKQLAIEDGLAVEEVTPDSPAAKAEIKKYDILVKAGDAPLKNIADLVKAVDASQGKELTITIVRNGKNQTIKVIADKRPKSERGEVGIDDVKRTLAARSPELAAEIKQLEESLEKLKGKIGKEGLGFWLAKPAVVAPRVDVRIPENWRGAVAKAAEFPKDLSVQINKEGGQPVKIHVKVRDKEWDVTEDKLGELPGDLRPYVEQMLGKAAAAYKAVRVTPGGKVEGDVQIAPLPPRPPVPPKLATGPQAPTPPKPPTAQANRAMTVRTHHSEGDADAKLDAIIKKLDDRSETIEKLDKKVEELRKEIDQLRKK
jgi:hypothetical protein